MRTIPVERWGKKKERASKKEVAIRAIEQSTCQVVPGFDEAGEMSLLGIEFRGELANLPNLKNRKIPGKVFTNPDVEGKLLAMDQLFCAAAEGKKLSFGSQEVFILLICANRPRSFDVDSCMVTVRDWLEPNTKIVGKKVRSRGWGIGVLNDDKQARGIAIKWSDLGFPQCDFTYIEVMLWRDISTFLLEFLTKICRRSLLMGSVAAVSSAKAQ